jgi:predicted glycosyltransferase
LRTEVAVSNARILMYTQDSFGLGHLRRSTHLANALVARRADLSVLLVVDSPVAPFFELQPHIDFIKLPTVVKVGAGVFRSGRLAEEYEEVRALRSSVLRETALQFEPDVVLVDHMPGGANRELVPTLASIRRRGLSSRIVLGLRDIIDEPALTHEVWRREQVYETLQDYYDLVLIYGSPEVFDAAEEYGIARVMGERVEYCGYVCTPGVVRPPERVRAELGLGPGPVVTVTAGGGADAGHLMRAYLDAVQMLGTRPATVMLTGPFMAEEEVRRLAERGSALGVLVQTSVGDAPSLLHAADVVVSMAGYNTLSEIVRLGKRAVIVPRAGPSAEQRLRARLFAERGLIDVVEPTSLDGPTLARALEKALLTPQVGQRRLPDLSGVARASEALLECLPRAPAQNGPSARGSSYRSHTTRNPS